MITLRNPPIGVSACFYTKEIKETKIVRLMYRIKYKTKDGDRQRANAYMVGLLP